MIRKILAPIRADGEAENVLAHASVIARRFDAHIEALYCRPRPQDLMPFGVPIPGLLRDQIIGSATEVANAEETRLRGEFDQLVARLGLTQTDDPNAAGGTIHWREAQGKQVDVIKSHGRLADLIVVAKPDRDRNLGANTLKSALFHTGRPVLMCPRRPLPPTVLGENIALAWNGSTEAARAVALNLDLIQKASSLVVLTIGHEESHGATAEDLLAYLAARGVSATLERMPAADNAGAALLRAAQNAGRDLVLMGAYGDSHERETLFGGNTQTVVDSTAMPIVLVH